MSNQQRIPYRGCTVIAQWAEVVPPSNWAELEPLQRGWSSRFTASFSVTADGVFEESWQQFLTNEFDTPGDALANAVTKACQMIDAKLAERFRNTSRSGDGLQQK
jgi:hypothetical protein